MTMALTWPGPQTHVKVILDGHIVSTGMSYIIAPSFLRAYKKGSDKAIKWWAALFRKVN